MFRYAMFGIGFLALACSHCGCGKGSDVLEDYDALLMTHRSGDHTLLILRPKGEWETSGAYFWDELIAEEGSAWFDTSYTLIATSGYGDQIVMTSNSPIHQGAALYLLGPDVAGPDNSDPNWPDCLIYLGPSYDDWLARVRKYGDEHSIAPGSIDETCPDPDEYRKLYAQLNPGLSW